MEKLSGMGAGCVGFVASVVSQRRGVRCVPLDLLRVNARIVSRVATRRRLARAFGGYLVTEAGPVVGLWSRHREFHLHGVLRLGMTGGVRLPFMAVLGSGQWWGALDAPEWIATGGAAADSLACGDPADLVRRCKA